MIRMGTKMRRPNGYDSYRGRSPVSTVLKMIALLLALLLVLAVGGLFFLEPYWVYSADGAQLHLPWMEPEPTPADRAEPGPSEPLIIVTPEPEVSKPLHALLLDRSALSDGTAVQQLQAVGADAALFDMKADDGTLGFVSTSEIAVSAQVNPSDPARNAAIQVLNNTEDLYTVARVSCFRDNTVPKYQNGMAVRSSGGNWRDSGNHRWLSPSSPEARQYVTGLCLELAGLGFDEILLDYAGYPVDGKLSAILKNDAYDPERLESTITAFYSDLSATLKAAYPEVTLSVVADPAALVQENDSPSGQNLGLAKLMDRVWLYDLGEERKAVIQLLEENGLAEAKTALVSLGPLPGAANQSWAVWPSA